MLIQSVAVRHLEIFERRKAFAQAHFQCRDAFYVISLSQSAVFAPCRSETLYPEPLVPVPLDKGNAGSGNEIVQDGERPQFVSAQISEMIWILRTIQVTLDRVITRSVNRSLINSIDFQRIHFGGHPLEQIVFEACPPPVELRVLGS